MAISRDKKQTLVAEVSESLANAKMTAFAKYKGLTVADLQELRKKARETNVSIKVVKNRLVRVAVENSETYKNVDTSMLEGQLVYAFSSEDEVAPAQVLDVFAKTNPALELVGGFSGKGETLDTDQSLSWLAKQRAAYRSGYCTITLASQRYYEWTFWQFARIT